MAIHGNRDNIERRKWTRQDNALIYVKFSFEFLKRIFILILIKPSVGFFI